MSCDDNGGIVGEQQPNALPPQQIVQLFGCLAIFAFVAGTSLFSKEVGERLGFSRDTPDVSGLLRWHFWVVAWIVSVPLCLFVLTRALSRWSLVQRTISNYGSLDFLRTAGLGALIYAVVGAGWLSIFGDRALFGALLLTLAILLLILRSRGRGIEPSQK